MDSRTTAIVAPLVLGLVVLGVGSPATATTRRFVNTDCDGLALSWASGVPDGEEHRYAFKGICAVRIEITKDGKSQSVDKARLWSEAKVVWNEGESTLREVLTIQDEADTRYNGDVESIYRCGRDPLLYPAECLLQHHRNSTPHAHFTSLAKSKAFSVGRTTLEEAAAFSQKSASGSVPPPPPPPPPAKPKAKLKQAPQAAQPTLKQTPRLQQAPASDEPPASDGPQVVTFQEPAMDEYRVDYCFFWGEKCGQPAATAFCVEKGYAGALEWEVDEDIGEHSPTRTLGDKLVCDQPGCDGFFKITCSK